MAWLDALLNGDPPPAGLAEWAASQADRQSAWIACPKPDWQLWLAAHVPSLSSEEQRTVVRAAVAALGDDGLSYLGFVRPSVSVREALAAWARPSASPLDSRQKLIATNQAFVVALVLVVVVDRLYGGVFGTGTMRAIVQAGAVFIGWGVLALPFVAIRRAIIVRKIEKRSFRDAIADAASLLQAAAGVSADRQMAVAQRMRGNLRSFAAEHFR